MKDGIQIQTDAVKALQEAIEAHLNQMLHLTTYHRHTKKTKRENTDITITQEDLELIREITKSFTGCELKYSERLGAKFSVGNDEEKVHYGKPKESEEGEPKGLFTPSVCIFLYNLM